MRKNAAIYFLIFSVSILAAMSCSGEYMTMGNWPYPDDDTSKSEMDYDDESERDENNHSSSDDDLTTGSVSDLESFDIYFDATALSEDDVVPTDENDPLYEDYVENYAVQYTVTVVWQENTVVVSGDTDCVSIATDGCDAVIRSAVKGMRYILKGNGSDGMLSVYSDYKFRLDLDDLTLSNADGPAINIQSGKRAYVVISGANVLSDSSTYATSDEDRKGTFFSEGQLCFSGTGTLDVTGCCKNGIVSDDYLFFRNGPVINVTSSGTNGMKANDWIHINGGVLNVESTAAGGKCLSSDGYIRVNGGRTTLMTTGGVDVSDYSSSCCVKSDSIFVMTKGELLCKSTGQGGKGIKADMNAYFNGGTVRVITTGSDYGSSGGGWGGSSYTSNTARPKGIRVEGKLFINGGDIMVRVASHEGIESKSYIEVNGGRIMVRSYDDAINSAGELIFNGGYVYSRSTSNDALDSNGNMTFNGGVILAAGPSSGAECAIDVNAEGRAYITMNGGTVVGIGAGNSTPSTGTQCYSVYGSSGMGGGFGGGRPGMGGSSSSGSITSGIRYAVVGNDSKTIVSFTSPVNGSSLFLSTPELVKGTSYTLMSGVTIEGGNDFCGLVTGAEATSGTSSGTLTVIQP